ncbi:hypothetical protein ANN_05563 [Periplaneta americana]|uniref:Uncharacterized protein n=1 Tax=Periplaneta americana TaxID=6978 RepID=A0ABQ8TB62_PERAM|nr:hypothetical protein ANN_05563 [Periplaneta americana]
MVGLCEGGNEQPQVSVDGIGDSEMIFGEMRPRIRLGLPCIHITIGENLGKKPNQSLTWSGREFQRRGIDMLKDDE